jgi:hypothetical protein
MGKPESGMICGKAERWVHGRGNRRVNEEQARDEKKSRAAADELFFCITASRRAPPLPAHSFRFFDLRKADRRRAHLRHRVVAQGVPIGGDRGEYQQNGNTGNCVHVHDDPWFEWFEKKLAEKNR